MDVGGTGQAVRLTVVLVRWNPARRGLIGDPPHFISHITVDAIGADKDVTLVDRVVGRRDRNSIIR
jgi:hypothetical protein